MTDPEMTPIPAGALFTITTGAYSSYYIVGVFRATQEINTSSLVAAYLSENPEQCEKYRFKEREFLGWLAQKGLLEPVETWEWHLGDYGNVREMYVDKN